MNKSLHNDRGSTLVLVLIFLVIMQALIVSFMMISSVESQLSVNKVDTTKSFHAADAGIEYAKYKVRFMPGWESFHKRAINYSNFPTDPWTYIDDPKDVWDEQIIPNPDGTESYFQVWVEHRPYVDPITSRIKAKRFMLSRGSHERGVKTVEAEYYIPCESFKFAYFAEDYIHLDNHGQSTTFLVGSSAFTNGEFELSGDMLMERGSEDDYVAALGHISIGGICYNDIYSPSVDTYGPDGKGRNGQSFKPWYGTIFGNIHLMDGWKLNPNFGMAPDETQFLACTVANGIGINGGNYGYYDSVAAHDIGEVPGSGVGNAPAQTNVIVHSDAVDVRDDPGTVEVEGNVYSYDGCDGNPGQFDPNDDPRLAFSPPNKQGKVLLYQPLPIFRWQEAYEKAQRDGTWFADIGDFKDYFKNNATQITIGSSNYLELGLDANNDGIWDEALWYCGDGPDNDGDFIVELDEINDSGGGAPWDNDKYGAILHGGLIIEGSYSSPKDQVYHIYACGNYDTTVDESHYYEPYPGATPIPSLVGYGMDYKIADSPSEGPPSDYGFPDSYIPNNPYYTIPYSVPAIVAGDKISLTGRKKYAFIHGITYCKSQIHIHNGDIEGTQFIYGAESCVIIHNCLWMEFHYHPCVQIAGNEWFWTERPDLLEIVDWRVVQK